jgi:lipopolysaccharide export system protein LptA
MQPRKNSVLAAVMLCLSCAIYGAVQGPRITNADGYISGFLNQHITIKTDSAHFLVIHAPGSQIHIVSTVRHFEATCNQAEGDIVKHILADATLSGDVHAVVQRPSSAKGSGTQTATADGSKAIYSAENNTLDMEDSVVLHDTDPGVNREVTATGSSAQVSLSPQGSTGDAFRSVILQGPVKMDMKGTRLDSATSKRVPYSIHATSRRATFDNIRRIVVLEGNVHVISNDPNMPGDESGISKETITLNPDGSVNTVDAEGNPGASTISPETLKGP